MKFYYTEPPSAYSPAKIVECEVKEFIVEGGGTSKLRTELHFTYQTLSKEEGLKYSKIREKNGVWDIGEFLTAEGFFTDLEDAIEEFERLLSEAEEKVNEARAYLDEVKSL